MAETAVDPFDQIFSREWTLIIRNVVRFPLLLCVCRRRPPGDDLGFQWSSPPDVHDYDIPCPRSRSRYDIGGTAMHLVRPLSLSDSGRRCLRDSCLPRPGTGPPLYRQTDINPQELTVFVMNFLLAAKASEPQRLLFLLLLLFFLHKHTPYFRHHILVGCRFFSAGECVHLCDFVDFGSLSFLFPGFRLILLAGAGELVRMADKALGVGVVAARTQKGRLLVESDTFDFWSTKLHRPRIVLKSTQDFLLLSLAQTSLSDELLPDRPCHMAYPVRGNHTSLAFQPSAQDFRLFLVTHLVRILLLLLPPSLLLAR